MELGDLANAQWDKLVSELPNEKKELLNTLLNPDFSKIDFPNLKGEKLATRDSNGKILNALAAALPGFIGGSADLAPSNKTELKGLETFQEVKICTLA